METGQGIKYKQLHIEDYLQEIPAEQGMVTEVSGRIDGMQVD